VRSRLEVDFPEEGIDDDSAMSHLPPPFRLSLLLAFEVGCNGGHLCQLRRLRPQRKPEILFGKSCIRVDSVFTFHHLHLTVLYAAMTTIAPASPGRASTATSALDTSSEIAKLRADQAALLETVLAMKAQLASMSSPRLVARSSSISSRGDETSASGQPPPLLIPASQITRATEDELIAMRKVFALFDSSGHGIIDAKDLQALHQKL
jgi:hypothetical protein